MSKRKKKKSETVKVKADPLKYKIKDEQGFTHFFYTRLKGSNISRNKKKENPRKRKHKGRGDY